MNLALLIKMITYYEQKVQTLKQALFANNENNIINAFMLIKDSDAVINKANLLNFFILNLEMVNYKDVILLLYSIGDQFTFTIDQNQFNNFIKSLLSQHQTPPLLHSNKNINTQIVKLLRYSTKIIKEIREKRTLLNQMDMVDSFKQISKGQEKITCESLKYFMKKHEIIFTDLDYQYFSFALFGQPQEISFAQFRDSILFKERTNSVPEESTEIQPIYISRINQVLPSNNSVLEFQVASPKSETIKKPRTKQYVESTLS